jgi:hypothetical protein
MNVDLAMRDGRIIFRRPQRGECLVSKLNEEGAAMLFYEKGPVRIQYAEAGSGFPLLLVPGGGLNSTIALLKRGRPFNSIE